MSKDDNKFDRLRKEVNMKLLNRIYIGAKSRMIRASESVKEFLASESGIDGIVVTIIILLIAVLLIAVFWGRLKEWVSGIMDQIFGTSFDTEGL